MNDELNIESNLIRICKMNGKKHKDRKDLLVSKSENILFGDCVTTHIASFTS